MRKLIVGEFISLDGVIQAPGGVDDLGRNIMPQNPLDLLNCLCANVRKTDRAITRLYDLALRPSGLNAGQFALLSVLTEVGSLRITDLARVMVMEQTTVTRNVDFMRKEGWLMITASEDRRVREVSATESGRHAHALACPLWSEVQTSLTQGLGGDRWENFLRDLSSVRTAIDAATTSRRLR